MTFYRPVHSPWHLTSCSTPFTVSEHTKKFLNINHVLPKRCRARPLGSQIQWQLLPCSPSRQYTTRWYVIFYHPSPPGPALLTSAPNSRLDGRRPHNLPHRPRRHSPPNPPSHRQHLSMSLSRRILTLKSSKAKNIHHGYEGF